MAEKKALKEEVKKLLNSILCGYQKGATLRQLNGDYEMMEGHPLPYRKLGFTNIEDFLRSISDAVYMSFERGEMVVRAVANEQNMKILDLVSRQKTSSKKRGRGGGRRGPPRRSGYGGGRGGGGGRPRFSYQQPRVSPRFRPAGYMGNYGFSDDDTGGFMDDFEFTTEFERAKPAPQKPTVPNSLRQQLCELVNSYKDGLNAANFELAFKRRFGTTLKYRELGFNELYDLLTEIPDIVEIELYPGGAYRVYWKKPQQQTSNSSSNEFRKRKDESSNSQNLVSANRNKGAGDIGSNSRIDDKWTKYIQLVLDRHPDGLWATKMSSEFKSITGKELPYKSLGFLSVIEMMDSLPGVVTIERPNSKDWLLFDARVKKGPHAPTVNKSSMHKSASRESTPAPAEKSAVSSSPSLTSRFKETLRQVLLTHPRGISLGEVEPEFQRLTGSEIPFHDLGFGSIDALVTCQQIQNVLKMEYVGDGNVLIFGLKTDNKVPNLLIEIPSETNRREIPMDAVGPGTYYRPMSVPEDEPAIVVFVSNVTNPGLVWVQLKGEGTTDSLEQLMDMLDEFYNSQQSKAYAMPESLIRVGQVCAAIFPEDENWHRVTITGIRDMDFVEVYYVDYGSQTSVPRSSLMMLRSKYLKLPAQAIKARLANLSPLNGKTWPNNATCRLLQMVSNIPVVALPTYYDKIHQVWSVCLCDTGGFEDVHINDQLVVEGLAVQMEDDYASNTLSAHQATEVLLGAPGSKAGEAQSVEPPSDLRLHLPDDSHQPLQLMETNSVSESEMSKEAEETEETEEEDEEYVRNVRYVELTEDYSIHIVKYTDKPHCCTGEISALMWEKDLLRSMLRQKKATFPKMVLPKEEHPDIFQEFQEYEVKGTIEGNEVKSHVTIYGLDVVIKILHLFEHPCEELKVALQQQIDTFDPNEPYWRGEDSEEDEEDDDTQIDLSLTDLETAQNHLQLQRKKILHQLRTDADNVTMYVDQLDQVERKLVEVRSCIKKLQDKSTNENTYDDPDRLVQLCVDEQYKNEVKVKDKPSKKVKPMPQQQQTASPTRRTNAVAPMPASPKEEVRKPQAAPPPPDLASAFASMSMATQNLYHGQPTMDRSNLLNTQQAMNQLAHPTAQQLPDSQQQLLQQYQMMLQQMPYSGLAAGGIYPNPLQGIPNMNAMMAAAPDAYLHPQMVGMQPLPNMSPASGVPFVFPTTAAPSVSSNFNMQGLMGQSNPNVQMTAGGLPAYGYVGRGLPIPTRMGTFPDQQAGCSQTNSFPGMMGNVSDPSSQGQSPPMYGITLNELLGRPDASGAGNVGQGRGYEPAGSS